MMDEQGMQKASLQQAIQRRRNSPVGPGSKKSPDPMAMRAALSRRGGTPGAGAFPESSSPGDGLRAAPAAMDRPRPDGVDPGMMKKAMMRRRGGMGGGPMGAGGAMRRSF